MKEFDDLKDYMQESSTIMNNNVVKRGFSTGIDGLYILEDVIEIFGDECSGKSSLAYKLVAALQEQNKQGLLIDTENSFQSLWAEKLGVDTTKLHISLGSTDSFALIEYCAACFDFIVVDSLGGLLNQTRNLKAGSVITALKSIVQACQTNNCILILTNQVRDNGRYLKSPGGKVFHKLIPFRIMLKNCNYTKLKKMDRLRISSKVVKSISSEPFETNLFDIYLTKAS